MIIEFNVKLISIKLLALIFQEGAADLQLLQPTERSYHVFSIIHLAFVVFITNFHLVSSPSFLIYMSYPAIPLLFFLIQATQDCLMSEISMSEAYT